MNPATLLAVPTARDIALQRARMINRYAGELAALEAAPPPRWRLLRRRRWAGLVAAGRYRLGTVGGL